MQRAIVRAEFSAGTITDTSGLEASFSPTIADVPIISPPPQDHRASRRGEAKASEVLVPH